MVKKGKVNLPLPPKYINIQQYDKRGSIMPGILPRCLLLFCSVCGRRLNLCLRIRLKLSVMGYPNICFLLLPSTTLSALCAAAEVPCFDFRWRIFSLNICLKPKMWYLPLEKERVLCNSPFFCNNWFNFGGLDFRIYFHKMGFPQRQTHENTF